MDFFGLVLGALALSVAALGVAPVGSVQPTVWAAAFDGRPQVNVFYEHDAGLAARRWQAVHYARYAATILTRDGDITLDGSYQRALIVTARIRTSRAVEMRYVLPYTSASGHVALYPMMVMEHGRCAYAPASMTAYIARDLRRDVAMYGSVMLTFAPALEAQERVCNQPQNV